MAWKDISFTINGIERRILCDPDRNLLRVLREDLGLTGAKEGCGKGHCGTCAVLVNGKVVLACRMPVIKVRGAEVMTIEGLGGLDHPHPLQLAFATTGAIQCGFCTPGIIIRAKALLDGEPSPDRRQIAKSLRPHLCRCTGYQKIVDAVELGAAILRGEAPAPQLLTKGQDTLGKPVVRRDALAKATGGMVYAADMPLPGSLHLKVLRSPHHSARIGSLKISLALAAPGVVDVLTAADVRGSNILKMAGDDQPLLCWDRVRFVGDPVAVVAAWSEEQAAAALELIKVEYEPLAEVSRVEESLREDAPLVHDDRPNLVIDQPIVHGDVATGWADSQVTVRKRYHTQCVEHAYLEPDSGVAYVDERGVLVIKACSQNIHQHKKTIAGALGLELEQVRVVQMPMGGAFGGRLDVSVGGILGLAALKLQRPVRLTYTREETFMATTKRHPFTLDVALGASQDGKLQVLEIDAMADAGAYASFTKSVVTRAITHVSGPYRWPHARIRGRAAYTNTSPKGAMRGFGAPQAAFAIESAMDELAAQLDMDPLHLRLKNGITPGDETVFGQTLPDAMGFSKCLERIDPLYRAALEEAAQEQNDGLQRGVGLAAVWFGPGRSAPDQSEAWAELLPDDTLQVWIGAADMGQGSDTMFWQIAAQAMGWPLERVRLCTTDTGRTPDGNFSAGSRQTYVSGRAVELAVSKLRRAMEEAGTSTYEEMREQGLSTKYQVVHKTQTTKLDPQTGQGVPWETYSFGVQMAEVTVDAKAGKYNVLRLAAVHDMGTVINRLNVEGQLHGGMAMGLGYAVSENFIYNQTNSLAKFRIPRATDVPSMEVHMVQVPRANGPFGASGAGEFADVPTAPAIANAIANACAIRLRSLPLKLKI